jgi:hypothetical protein
MQPPFSRGAEIMSKLEEVSSKRLALVDSFDARKNHLLMIALTSVIGLVYTSFLWLVCSTIPGITSALLLFGSQIAMGFPVSRAYYDLGVSNRENLHFIDPARFNGNGQHHDIDIHLAEIPLIFEKIGIQIQKYDKGSLDDLSDLVWFGIFVWATISSASFYLGFSGNPICLVGTLVLVTACLGSYLSGYRTQRSYDFEDDLNHLQYYVEKRLRDLDEYLPRKGSRFSVQVLERWRALILTDFSINVEIKPSVTLVYQMGFPSVDSERIVIEADDDLLKQLSADLQRVPFIADNDWTVQQNRSVVEIVNNSSDFSVNNRSTFVISPSMVDETSKVTAGVFSKVLSLTS